MDVLRKIAYNTLILLQYGVCVRMMNYFDGGSSLVDVMSVGRSSERLDGLLISPRCVNSVGRSGVLTR